MRDESNQNCDSIRVRIDGPSAPYLLIATTQVPQVQVLFDSVGFKYTLSERSADPTAECELTTLTFDGEANADEIQRILDELD